jgi:lipoic acid synthetase
MEKSNFTPKPQWLKVAANSGEANTEVMELMKTLSLHTVCQEADCPNCGECFGRKTATFMILGRQCTRNCTFCCVSKGEPDLVDSEEPLNLANAVEKLGLRYVVITSVTRDDLKDGGAGHFAAVIHAIKEQIPVNTPKIEVLIPDFQGNRESLVKVVAARPDVLNHNIETVPRLYGEVRPMANYAQSLALLRNVKEIDPFMLTKSGIMVGLGETESEVESVFNDLHQNGCDFLTIGQYLPPTKKHHPLIEYVTPEQFEKYKEKAYQAGFSYVASGPLVRSSYQAHEAWNHYKNN